MDYNDFVAALKGFVDTPELDVRIFCDGRKPNDDEILDFIHRRKKGEPVSKIMGEKGFYKHVFKTSQDVLDPRPDSETLIEAVLSVFLNHQQALNILDIGTGSGCLLASLLYEYPHARGTGIDISDKALSVARENTRNLNATLIQKDFMQAGWEEGLGVFDIIVSNPPYIPSDEIANLDTAVKVYDPLVALDGGKDGLNAYRRLSQTLKGLLAPGGKVFFEIGRGQQEDVVHIMQAQNWAYLSAYKDLGGIVRILAFER